MSKENRSVDDLKELLEIIDRINKVDKDDDIEMFNFDIKAPYLGGRTPKPERWQEKSLKYVLP